MLLIIISLSTTSKKFNSLRKNIYKYFSNLANIHSKLTNRIWLLCKYKNVYNIIFYEYYSNPRK